MKNLKELILDDNQIEVLPKNIGFLKSTLHALSLKRNPIRDSEKIRLKKLLPNTQILYD